MLFFCAFQIYFSTIQFCIPEITKFTTVNGHPFHHPYALSGRFIHLGCPDNLIHDKAMEFEILKNILASLVSVVTLMFMLFRYLHKRDVSNAKLIADTIRDATQKAFSVSHIESRVREIEDIQAENTKAIQDLNNSLNKRLDQLFIAIANIKGNHND